MQPKILIVAPQPFNQNEQSRSMKSYFGQFEPGNLAQIFSDARTPCKGNCQSLFQITDFRLIKRRFNKKLKTGKKFDRNTLPDSSEKQNNKFKPKNKTPIYRFIRRYVWKKKYWDTPELESFVKEFQPDYVFIVFSPDFFVFDIAMHFADMYKIPIIGCVYDDYVFNNQHQGQFLNRVYHKKYLKTISQFMSRDVHLIFESEKIKNKYLSQYKVPSDVIYIASDIPPRKTTTFDASKDWYYFGGLEYGRRDTLETIAQILSSIGSTIKIHAYSRSIEKTETGENLTLHPAIPYNEMLKLMEEAGALLIVEGMNKDYLRFVEYSLSTKVGDTLCFGKPVIAAGNKDAGAITFLTEKKACWTATTEDELRNIITNLASERYDSNVFERQYLIANECFSVDTQSSIFLKTFTKNLKNIKN